MYEDVTRYSFSGQGTDLINPEIGGVRKCRMVIYYTKFNATTVGLMSILYCLNISCFSLSWMINYIGD
jgi:hypothetical protein